MTVRGQHGHRVGPQGWVRATRLTVVGVFALALVLTVVRIADLLSA